ncbi:MAG TPA: NAD+ synthase [Gammaproteobacteria bacterium]|nr:NAD+ synthase [Gammaproteobacteria bacterium]
MSIPLRITLAQLNLRVGDIAGNLQKHLDAAITARDQQQADVIVFPELSLTGYPPEDLLLRKAFILEAQQALQTCLTNITGIYCLIGHPQQVGTHLYNACSLIYNAKLIGCYAKQHLPNYGVFDEKRYFSAGNTPCVVPIKGVQTGLIVCEDLWKPTSLQQAVAQGAQLILSPNASPFETDKHERRIAMLSKQAKQHRVPIVYVNLVGGQDELIFDGGSMAVNAQGDVTAFAGFFQEVLLPINNTTTVVNQTSAQQDKIARIYQALVFSTREYVEKNHFSGVLLGLSGGIDSALTLAIAVDALGKDRVTAVMMPSRYTAEMSIADAKTLAQQLDVKIESISIEPSYASFLTVLAPLFARKKPDVTEENIQARCRAILLMALANKQGQLVLTTGNRSELAVGYCTLYGDMAGGFAVLKDIPKTLVYQLATYRNQLSPVIPVIPQRIIDRPPTAELAENQQDEDSLPSYAVLDAILEAYLNKEQDSEEIIAQGFDRDTVLKVVNLIHKNEYKRRQSAIGPRINHKAFGKDWRYPITMG